MIGIIGDINAKLMRNGDDIHFYFSLFFYSIHRSNYDRPFVSLSLCLSLSVSVCSSYG